MEAPTAPPPAGADNRARSGGPPLTKLTVNVTPRATAALDEAADINAESKTNVVNRAIQLYAFLTRMTRDGWEVVLRDPREGGREQVVHFL